MVILSYDIVVFCLLTLHLLCASIVTWASLVKQLCGIDPFSGTILNRTICSCD